MPRQHPVREYSAERRERLRHLGAKTQASQGETGLVELLAAIQEIKDDIAALRGELDRREPAGADGSQEGLEVRVEIAQMVRIITQAKQEIASIKHPMSQDDRMLAATSELDAIVLATETSTNDILAAAEAIESQIRTISGRYPDDEDLQAMTDHAANEIIKIFEACNFQDITGQRTTKVIKTIRFIEQRILAMIDIWGIEAFAELPIAEDDAAQSDKNLMNGPQLSGKGISQEDINALFD